MALIQEAKQFIQASTFTTDQSATQQLARRRVAHQTLEQLKETSEQSNSHYLDNLAQISMTYEAKVLLDMLWRVYDRPGRVAMILDGKDEQDQVILNQRFVRDPEGRPLPIGDQPPPPTPDGKTPEVEHYNLKKGSYGAVVSIGRSYQTRMQQGSDAMGQLLQADPSLMPIIGWRYFQFNDNIPGHKEIAEDLKKLRPPQLQDDEGQAPDPRMLMGQIQQLQQQLQQAGKALETDKIKTDAQLQIKAMDLQFQREKLQIESETKLAVAQLGAKVGQQQMAMAPPNGEGGA
jgi:hypothetical protein